ncbi:MAG: aminotransferase class V-fold PLP-dependent enzyme [Planctomycetaceae bacterium]|nr:aminotransferase class V-fold PLP-dependent enzyme [Planctomycetales bacterium]MCB9927163.1 aminotransferase class V-fold PLP-dependent enzyme [Planctomycetaceae bacterium]
MVQTPVYMDNHATTRVDPRVVEAMLPLFHEKYGNAGSTSHVFGWDAKEAVDRSRESIARSIGASSREIVFTSGATESNNLAIRGCAERTRRRGNHIVSVATEHKAILDPLAVLARRGFEVTLLPVRQMGEPVAGRLDVERVADAIRDDTLLVTVMLANNEIGVIQPLVEIGNLCKQRGVLLHTDATQAVGKIPVDVEQMQIDLLSFSGHKLYGPKGIGGLYVRRRGPQVRLTPQIDGGGQEGGRRSGTLNVPGIVGFARALELCVDEMEAESNRLFTLRDRLYQGLTSAIEHVTLNGPELDQRDFRLAGNLSCSFADVDGEALMMSMRDLCVSSGSACTSTNPEPSHVLRAIGLSDDRTRASLRFGIGRFNTEEEVDFAIGLLAEVVQRLRRMSSLA